MELSTLKLKKIFMFQEGISGENWKLEKCKNPALKYFLYFEK